MMVGSRFMAIVCAAAFLAGPVAVHAQLDSVVPVGSHIAQEPESVDLQVARKMQKSLGDCIYARESETSDRFLENSDPLNTDFDRLGFGLEQLTDELDLERCLGRAMRIGQQRVAMRTTDRILRSLLVEEAYLDRRDTPFPAYSSDGTLLPDRFFVSAPGQARAREMAALADCVIGQAPIVADAMLRTAPSSSDEREAAEALAPTVANCLGAGSSVVIDHATLRGIVADGLWALSHSLVANPVDLEVPQ